MEKKKFWMGMLVVVLVFGMTVVGCNEYNLPSDEITVTFIANGGYWDDGSAFKTVNTTKGSYEAVGLTSWVPNPKKANFTFVRWAPSPTDNPDGSRFWTFSTDITVYALWKEN